MESIKLSNFTLEIGKGQPQYTVLHASRPSGPTGEMLMCFELTDEEIAAIVKTKRIYYSRSVFDNKCPKPGCGQSLPFQPMRLFTQADVVSFDPKKA